MSTFNFSIENPGRQELRKFGLVTGAIVVVLFGLLLPWVFGFAWPTWPWILAGVLGLWALVHPDSLFVVYKYWMRFGVVAGWINTRIILGIMFYLIFFPTGMIIRLFGKDAMARKWDDKAESYRIISNQPDKDHVERPY